MRAVPATFPLPDVPPPWGPVDRVPDWLAPIVEAVLTDLQRPEPIDLRVGWTGDGGDDHGTLWLDEPGQSWSLTGVSVARGDVAEVMFELADGLQEQFFPESFGAWGQARPACPGHTHPAEPTVIAAVACWVCPSTGEVLGPIGAYAP